MIDVNEINLDAIRSTITFLSENEEYGDAPILLWYTIGTLSEREKGTRNDRSRTPRYD